MIHSQFNATKQLELADTLTILWRGLFPDFETPAQTQFLTWAATASESTTAYAFNRARSKSRRQPMTADQLGRYISGILRNEREGRHIFPQKENQLMTEPTETLTPEQAAAVLEAGYAQHQATDPLAHLAADLIDAGKTTFADARAALDEYNSVSPQQ
jgi:hypothetical protein